MTEPIRRPPPLTAAALLVMVAIYALWGGTAVAIRYSVDQLPPVFVAGSRFLLAALFMVVWAWWERSELRLRPGQFIPCAIVGCLLFVQISLFNVGIEMSNASHGSMFINTFVFWVVGFEHYITREDRLSARKITGILVAAASVFLLLTTVKADAAAGRDSGAEVPTLTGDLVLCVAGALLGMKVVAMKVALRRVEPAKLVFWHAVVGVALFYAWSGLFETVALEGLRLSTVLGVVYQGVVVGGFCFAIQARLMTKYSASQVSLLAFSTPLWGITAAVVMRGDRLSPWLFLAAGGLAFGIWFVNRRPAVESGSSGDAAIASQSAAET